MGGRYSSYNKPKLAKTTAPEPTVVEGKLEEMAGPPGEAICESAIGLDPIVVYVETGGHVDIHELAAPLMLPALADGMSRVKVWEFGSLRRGGTDHGPGSILDMPTAEAAELGSVVESL